MLGQTRGGVYAAPCVAVLIGALLVSAVPVRAATKAVDFDGDGVAESTVVVQVLQTWPPEIRNSIFNNSGSDRLFSWINAGPGGFTSNAGNGGEIRWTWQTAQTVYSFTGAVCRNDLCIFGRNGAREGGAYGVPGRTVVVGQATTSTAALTSSLIQSFSPGETLLSCTSSVERLANGNFAYTTSCTNLTGETLEFEIDAQPLGCCEGTDALGNPNQLRCDVDVIIEPDDPETDEIDPITGRESVCLDYLTDNDNCGDCGVACLDNEFCAEGQCTSICPEGQTWCGPPHDPDGGSCVDLLHDAENCGACGEICPSTQATSGTVDGVCNEGECGFCPLSARTRCGNTCVNLKTNFENCGACGNDCGDVCDDGGTCQGGQSCVCDPGVAKYRQSAGTRIADGRRQERTKGEAAGTDLLRVAPRYRVAGATATQLGEGVQPPAPLCQTPAHVIVVPDGDTLSECYASPNLPVEANGQLKACGGLIPEGSSLCGAVFGSAGVFQQLEPGMLLPEPIELVIEDVQVTDGADGNGLIEPGDTACFKVTLANAGTEVLTSLTASLTSEPVDLECGVITGPDCVPDGDQLADVSIVNGQSAYPDLTGYVQTDPGNPSCFDAGGAPLPLATLAPAANEVEFCVALPISHPEDLVRPFLLDLHGFDSAGQPFTRQVVFSLGVGSICDFASGDFPDSVLGPGAPLAGFAPVETVPAPAATETITQGLVLPLEVTLTCGGGPVTDGDVLFGPRIVSLIGAAQGDVTPAETAFAYDAATGSWSLDLDTSALAPDAYTLTVRINDVKDYHTTFVLCGDEDGDASNDCNDLCVDDPDKDEPGICGCGVADTDADADGTAACLESCDDDPEKLEPGICGCGVADVDSDGDGSADCLEACDDDPEKLEPGICGCGVSDVDSDGDGAADCLEVCDDDPDKLEPGLCGCGVADTDADADGTPACNESCDNDPLKLEPGACGCGVADTDADADGTPACNESCDNDPLKLEPGACGCGVADTDADADGTPACNESCDSDPLKLEPGLCGCGVADTDADGDGTPACNESCDGDPDKLEPGICGCGTSDGDTDGDGTPNCDDECPLDENKVDPGRCDCGTPETDTDGDGRPDCVDQCGNGVRDPGEQCDDGNSNNWDWCRNNCRLWFWWGHDDDDDHHDDDDDGHHDDDDNGW